ncbi:MAG TPA: response regulator [Phenylobacterium sp.]|uniref:response regulator n=1 Tax=Phenylobacterium sp. TaxID=1871053 RepID=UPI002B49E62D|nr:response regulator [Phenylobacterium sp.]HKR89132.1 response regulator [Phenylobacterium sp.]
MPASATPSSAAPAPASPTVVLVDDDVALLQALRFALEIDGFRVVTCETGEQLVEIPLPAEACLVIDFRLSGLDGLAALDDLRRRGVTLPAILITSYASPALHARARCAQAVVLEKPLLGDVLTTCIREVLAPG